MILSLSVSEEAFISSRERYERLELYRQQILNGEYDNENFLKYVYPIRDGAKRIPLLRKYDIRNYENAPENIEFHDFKKISFNPDDIKNQYLSSIMIEKFYYRKDFLSINGYCKLDSKEKAKPFLILYNDNEAFEAELINDNNIETANRTSVHRNIYELNNRNYFTAKQLYLDAISSVKYNAVIKLITQTGKEYLFKCKELIKKE